MSEGIPYADVVILALIAGFILLRLRSILGEKNDDDNISGYLNRMLPLANRPQDLTIQADDNSMKSKIKDVTDNYTTRLESGPVRDGLNAIKSRDPQFSADNFLQGAKAAFEMVFDAFAKGDKKTLTMLLSDTIAKQFCGEVDARAAQARKLENTLVSIQAKSITDVALNGNIARLGVQFESEQIIVTRDDKGNIVEGDPSELHHVEDRWLFERDTTSKNPNWKIIET